MSLVVSSQSNRILKLFSSKLYKIRARPLDFLVQNLGPFTTPTLLTSCSLWLNTTGDSEADRRWRRLQLRVHRRVVGDDGCLHKHQAGNNILIPLIDLSRCILHFPTNKNASFVFVASGQGQDGHPGRGEAQRASLAAVPRPPVRQVRHGLLLRRAETQDRRPDPRPEMHEQGCRKCMNSSASVAIWEHALTTDVILCSNIRAGVGAGRPGHAWSRPAGDQQGLRPAPAGEEPQVHHMDGQVKWCDGGRWSSLQYISE